MNQSTGAEVKRSRRRRSRIRALSLSAALLAVVPGLALADEGPTAPKQAGPTQDGDYLAAIQHALAEHDLGNWEEAKVFFTRAHELNPNARTLRGLGLSSYELRSYVEAIRYFQQALESAERPLTDKLRSQVQDLLGRSRSFIAHYQLIVEPADARITVNGQPSVFDERARLLLDAGPHEITVESPGYESKTRKVLARAGDEITLNVKLVSSTSATEVTSVSAESDEVDGEGMATQKLVALGLGGAGLVGLAVGGVFGLLAMSSDSASEDNCQGNLCNETGFDDRDTARSQGDVATVGLIAGTALLGAGVVLWLTSPDEESGSQLSLRLSPTAGAGLHTQLGGRW